MRNLFLTSLMAIGLAVASFKAEAQGSTPAAQVFNGVPIYQGMFIGTLPALIGTNSAPTQVLNGNVTITGTLTTTGGYTNGTPTASIPTNTAALTRIANPLTTGSLYTTPAMRGILRVNVICTNNVNCALSNSTTGDALIVGAITSLGTNYANVTIETGPSEVIVLTNTTGNVGLISSEWRNTD